MFELPSARTFIAGGNEFLFARFYDVYEGVQLVQLESPPIVSGVPDMHPSDSQNVEETRIIEDANIWLVRNAIFFDRISICISNGNRKVRVPYNATCQNPASRKGTAASFWAYLLRKGQNR